MSLKLLKIKGKIKKNSQNIFKNNNCYFYLSSILTNIFT